jgi:hypothetical protein
VGLVRPRGGGFEVAPQAIEERLEHLGSSALATRSAT